ncbi:hypothetical protein DTW90_11110 [Neorhizobium sp. P12A]|nr:hypothetical protein DTW90_11110 [Neorhizobium sp. P12A]
MAVVIPPPIVVPVIPVSTGVAVVAPVAVWIVIPTIIPVVSTVIAVISADIHTAAICISAVAVACTVNTTRKRKACETYRCDKF